MKYDFILMNPPYNVGGKITKATLNSLTEDGKCVCLMPLAQYKKELYKNIESFELANPKMFEGADIVRNLCICVLKDDYDNGKTYEYFWRQTWSDNVRKVLDWNSSKPFVMTIQNYSDGTKQKFDYDTEIIECARLPAVDSEDSAGGFHGFRIGDNVGYRINVEKKYDTLTKRVCCIRFNKPSKKAKDNFVTWAYKEDMFKNFANMLLTAIKLDDATENCLYGIPQIDWESISDHELWKQGDYDGAVLDVMGLKWNEDKTGVVEKH